MDVCDILPVEGTAVTCGNRTELPRKQRRHLWAELGTDIRNAGEKGIIAAEVRACVRCGKDDR